MVISHIIGKFLPSFVKVLIQCMYFVVCHQYINLPLRPKIQSKSCHIVPFTLDGKIYSKSIYSDFVSKGSALVAFVRDSRELRTIFSEWPF